MRRKNIERVMKLHVDSFDLKNIVLRQSEPTDSFSREEYTDVEGEAVVHISDPVQMLLNQERLNKIIGITAAQAFIDSFRNQKVDPFAELRSKCSDADLLKMIKSRHLQAPAEILSWCRYMKDNVDTFNSELKALVEAEQAKSDETPEQDDNQENQ